MANWLCPVRTYSTQGMCHWALRFPKVFHGRPRHAGNGGCCGLGKTQPYYFLSPKNFWCLLEIKLNGLKLNLQHLHFFNQPWRRVVLDHSIISMSHCSFSLISFSSLRTSTRKSSSLDGAGKALLGSLGSAGVVPTVLTTWFTGSWEGMGCVSQLWDMLRWIDTKPDPTRNRLNCPGHHKPWDQSQKSLGLLGGFLHDDFVLQAKLF